MVQPQATIGDSAVWTSTVKVPSWLVPILAGGTTGSTAAASSNRL